MNDTTLPVGAPFGNLPERSSDAASAQGEGASARAARRPLAVPGERLGAWLVTRPLPGDSRTGRPGAAEVYVAGRAEGEPRTLVALRVQAVDDAPAMLQQLARVRQALARLPGQHWARVVDAGSASEDRVYVATELVEGVPIAQAMRSMPLPDRLRLLLPWLDALADAHRLLLVHGTLRASALRVTPAAAPVKRFGAFRLSPAEPEAPALGQVRAFGLGMAQALSHPDGPPIDTAADIRALGRLLHELLEGAPLDDADDADDALQSSELPVDLRAYTPARVMRTWMRWPQTCAPSSMAFPWRPNRPRGATRPGDSSAANRWQPRWAARWRWPWCWPGWAAPGRLCAPRRRSASRTPGWTRCAA